MNVIPVIDLLNGAVVHAKQGNRAQYQPIASQLTHSSKPLDIMAALLDYYPFKSLYIADLNSIAKNQSQTNHIDIVEAIIARFPTLDLWLDCGIDSVVAAKQWADLSIKPVLGTENFPDIAHYLTTTQQLAENNMAYCLSLDFMPNGFKGDRQFLSDSKVWPDEVIVMTLNKVGSQLGPDLAALEQIQQQSHANLYAAGGVRHLEDLITLKENHIHGALIATAIHQKAISPSQLASIEIKKA